MNAGHHHDHKLSRNQGRILSALRKAKEPLSAYAILDRVRVAGISHPPTVYRALHVTLEIAGLCEACHPAKRGLRPIPNRRR